MKPIPTIFEALYDACGYAGIRPDDKPLLRLVFKSPSDLDAFEREVRVELHPMEAHEAIINKRIRGIPYELRTSQRTAYPGDRADVTQAVINAKQAQKALDGPINRDVVINAHMALGDLIRIFDEPGIPPGLVTVGKLPKPRGK